VHALGGESLGAQIFPDKVAEFDVIIDNKNAIHCN